MCQGLETSDFLQCYLILTIIATLELSGTFLGVERAWADSVIKTIPVEPIQMVLHLTLPIMICT
jgi:hypothetical protein